MKQLILFRADGTVLNQVYKDGTCTEETKVGNADDAYFGTGYANNKEGHGAARRKP